MPSDLTTERLRELAGAEYEAQSPCIYHAKGGSCWLGSEHCDKCWEETDVRRQRRDLAQEVLDLRDEVERLRTERDEAAGLLIEVACRAGSALALVGETSTDGGDLALRLALWLAREDRRRRMEVNDAE